MNELTEFLAAPEGRAKTIALEKAIREQLPPVEIRVEEFHIDGVYIRKAYIPAGTALVSEVHATECFSIVSLGKISVTHDGPPKTYFAGDHIYSPPGTKRAALAHKDTIWTTINKNIDNERDPAKLRARFTVPAPPELQQVLGSEDAVLVETKEGSRLD